MVGDERTGAAKGDEGRPVAFPVAMATLSGVGTGKENHIGTRISIAGLMLVLAACGCQPAKAPPNGKAQTGETSVKLVPAPALTAKPEQSWRWLDAANNPYSEGFRAHFTYEGSEVTVRLARAAEQFRCTIRGRKLKPNFAYQAKFVGMPVPQWKERGDAATNRRLGDLGRWWRPGDEGGNLSLFTLIDDADKDQMEGYLLFGYFVTDPDGKADVELTLDSSYHVLWKVSQWPAAEADSVPTKHTIAARAGSYGYGQSAPPTTIELYAEAQYRRPPKGTLKLPAGDYKCFLLLTEESFHSYSDDGGDWAAALAAEVAFTILPPKPKADE